MTIILEDGSKIDWESPEPKKGPLPKKFVIPNPYKIPIRSQKGNTCTAHATAIAIEFRLSEILEERAIVDADDLWEKQKKLVLPMKEAIQLANLWELHRNMEQNSQRKVGKREPAFQGTRELVDSSLR